MDNDKIWYLYSEEEQLGPYSTEEINYYLEDGQINNQYYIWKEGFADWQQIETVLDFNLSNFADQTNFDLHKDVQLVDEDNTRAILTSESSSKDISADKKLNKNQSDKPENMDRLKTVKLKINNLVNAYYAWYIIDGLLSIIYAVTSNSPGKVYVVGVVRKKYPSTSTVIGKEFASIIIGFFILKWMLGKLESFSNGWRIFFIISSIVGILIRGGVLFTALVINIWAILSVCVGIGFGIYVISILMNKDVDAAFTGKLG